MVHIKYVGKREYLPILYTTEKIVSDFAPLDSQSVYDGTLCSFCFEAMRVIRARCLKKERNFNSTWEGIQKLREVPPDSAVHGTNLPESDFIRQFTTGQFQ